MNNYLLFRTDRIGDFLLSAILIKSIKRNDKNSIVTVVASKKNYNYIKTLKLVDKVILYPENFFKRFFFLLSFLNKKYKLKVALDGKKRSIYGCLLGRADYKILLTTKLIYKKILKVFFDKILYKNDFNTKILEIKYILHNIGYNLNSHDYNIFEYEELFKSKTTNKDHILLHFDEKWIFKDYIQKYSEIEPTYDQFYKFISEIVKKTNNDLHITTGFHTNDIVEKLKSSMTFNNNYYLREFDENKIYLHLNMSFIDLKKVILNSQKIICCHGAPTHVASAMNKEIIDIYDKSEESFYKKWNSHFRKYNFLYRSNFNNLSKEILKLL